jgi:hypothetical protein
MKVVLAAYLLAAALLPLGHHDLACHFKSTTHCTTCVIGSSAELTADAAALTRVPLIDAGRAVSRVATVAESVVLHPSSGRSPPAAL